MAATRDSQTYRLDVQLPSGRTVTVPVTRKRVRNLNLRVCPNGALSASVPWHASKADAQAFLDARAGWIEQSLERQVRRAADPGEMQGSIVVWGHAVQASETGRDAAEMRQLTGELYRNTVKQALPAVAARYEKELGVHAARWSVREMKTRWGSCTPATGAIRINSQLAAYPPICLDAVVAHELCHLIEPSHNARFHALLDAACPENRTAMALLKLAPSEAAAQLRQQQRQQPQNCNETRS